MQTAANTTDRVLFRELPARDGTFIGIVMLNAPRALNALSLEIIAAIDARLDVWEHDPALACLWLEGAGEKAFCAGGDIVALYGMLSASSEVRQSACADYFAREYALDRRLHDFSKPVIAWGEGLVMGGGFGLFWAADHRIVTATSRLAMPEVSIGLYPDVAATLAFAALPAGIGCYLALTGAQLNARDALQLGLANRLIAGSRREAVLTQLASCTLSDDTDKAIRRVLSDMEHRCLVEHGEVAAHFDHMHWLVDTDTVVQAAERIRDDTHNSTWLNANRVRFTAGCPTSAHLTWRRMQRPAQTLAQAFSEDLALSIQCCLHDELAEGIRALLIDKDMSPRWAYADIASVPAEYIDGFFQPLR